MPTERGSNGATTSINQSGGITSSATSVTVAASTSAGFPNLTATPGQFRVQVEQELWLVTATAGTDGVNWTITRHIEGTTAAAHVNGSQVVQKLTWEALENLAASGGTPAASAVTFTPAGGIAATDVQAALQEVDTEKAPKASPTFTGIVTTPALAVSGLTGSLSASRYVGATASGAPTTGAHLVGDWCWALDGHLWLCTANGTPGTWAQVSGGTPTSIANAGGSVVVDGSGNVVGAAAGGGAVAAIGGGAAISGVGWSQVAANADDSATIHGGPTGLGRVDISAAGGLLLQVKSGEDLTLLNVPTSDPSVSDAMWLDGGVLVKSGSTAGGGGVFTLQRTPLSSADILALDATPIEVAPAPASGKANVLSLAWLEVDAGGTNYTTGGANVWIGYANDPLGDGTIAFFPAAALNNTSYPLVYLAPSGGSGFPAACKDQALVLQSTGALTGGTRTATLTTVWCQA